MKHLALVLAFLAAASLACNLGNQPTQPTIVAVQPTIHLVTASPFPTLTSVPPTSAPIQNCSPRTEWLSYTVLPGDTLGSIASRTGSTTGELAFGNCISNANSISVGQQLYVPMVPLAPTPTSNTCPGNFSWFFTFTAGAIDRLCPNPVEQRSAIGEDFEG